MRLARGVEDLRATLGQDSSQQDVLGAGDGRKVEHDSLAMKAINLRHDLGLRLLDPRAHLPEPAKVLLESPGADVVAAWPWNPRLPEAAQQSAEEHDGRAHPAPEVIGHVAVV